MTRFAAVIALSAATTLFAAPSEAKALTPDQVKALMTNRNWYQDYGSFGSQVFGRVFLFDSPPWGRGWFKGSYVTFRGLAGTGTVLGMAWKPVTDGVIIDYGFRRATIRFVRVNSALEVLTIQGSDSNAPWSSTRSSVTPAVVRRLYFK